MNEKCDCCWSSYPYLEAAMRCLWMWVEECGALWKVQLQILLHWLYQGRFTFFCNVRWNGCTHTQSLLETSHFEWLEGLSLCQQYMKNEWRYIPVYARSFFTSCGWILKMEWYRGRLRHGIAQRRLFASSHGFCSSRDAFQSLKGSFSDTWWALETCEWWAAACKISWAFHRGGWDEMCVEISLQCSFYVFWIEKQTCRHECVICCIKWVNRWLIGLLVV